MRTMRTIGMVTGVAALTAMSGAARAAGSAGDAAAATTALPASPVRLAGPGQRAAAADGDDLPDLHYHLRGMGPGPRLFVVPGLATPAAAPRAGGRQSRLLLPVWVQMALPRWSVLGGGGSDGLISPGTGPRIVAHRRFALIGSLSSRLSLGAEFSHDSADLIDGHANTRVGVGANYRLSGPLSLILSAGPTFEHHGGSGLKAYTGLSLGF